MAMNFFQSRETLRPAHHRHKDGGPGQAAFRFKATRDRSLDHGTNKRIRFALLDRIEERVAGRELRLTRGNGDGCGQVGRGDRNAGQGRLTRGPSTVSPCGRNDTQAEFPLFHVVVTRSLATVLLVDLQMQFPGHPQGANLGLLLFSICINDSTAYFDYANYGRC